MNDSGTTIAALIGVSKRYAARPALSGLDLLLRRGEITALLGPNGAGKSTTISLLLGLLRPDSGKVELFGADPQGLAPRRRIGVMLQSAKLPDSLRVDELLRLTASYYPAPRPLAESAALAGVGAWLRRPYGGLSGGQQRRVQLALALCGRPELIFLDEPTVAMDQAARTGLWATLLQLRSEGCAVVLCSHYLEEAEALADRVCVLVEGRLVSDGSVDALRARVAVSQVRCRSTLGAGALDGWPGVQQLSIAQGRLSMMTGQPESVVRRLLEADPGISELEVRRAGLAEAFDDLLADHAAPIRSTLPESA